MASVSVFTDVKCGDPEQFSSPRARDGSLGLGPSRRSAWRRRRRRRLVSSPSFPRDEGLRRGQTPPGGLGQVTVGVLFTIHSLQIFLLDQNVNAFLGAIFRRGRGSERERKTCSGSERRRTSLHPWGTAVSPPGAPPPRLPSLQPHPPRGTCRPVSV